MRFDFYKKLHVTKIMTQRWKEGGGQRNKRRKKSRGRKKEVEKGKFWRILLTERKSSIVLKFLGTGDQIASIERILRLST